MASTGNESRAGNFHFPSRSTLHPALCPGGWGWGCLDEPEPPRAFWIQLDSAMGTEGGRSLKGGGVPSGPPPPGVAVETSAPTPIQSSPLSPSLVLHTLLHPSGLEVGCAHLWPVPHWTWGGLHPPQAECPILPKARHTEVEWLFPGHTMTSEHMLCLLMRTSGP